MPALVKKVVEVSGRKKIAFVGHSQGTTEMFVAMSDNHDFITEHVNYFAAFGPITSMNNVKDPLLSLG